MRGEDQSLDGGSDENAEAERTFTVPLLGLFVPNPPTRSGLLPAPPEPFAYSPGSGGQNQGRTRYHGKKGGPTGVCGSVFGGDKSRPQPASEEEPADRGIQG